MMQRTRLFVVVPSILLIGILIWYARPCSGQRYRNVPTRQVAEATTCHAGLPKSLQLPTSFVLKMSVQQWADYCDARATSSYYPAIIYYAEVLSRQNERYLRRLPRASQQQWRRTRARLISWAADFWAWWDVIGSLSWNKGPILRTDVYIEQAMSKVFSGHSRPRGSRKRSRKQINGIFALIRHDIIHAPRVEFGDESDVRPYAAKLTRSSERLRQFALQKSPNTQKAIADCIRRIEEERPF